MIYKHWILNIFILFIPLGTQRYVFTLIMYTHIINVSDRYAVPVKTVMTSLHNNNNTYSNGIF